MALALLRIHARRWLRRCVIAGLVLALACVVTLALAWWWFPFPIERLEQWPESPRVLDRHGAPMLQLVGGDDQWRMPVPLDEMSPWLVMATIAVEDERFRSHVGVDPIAVGRAVLSNLTQGRVVSGASTLSMQVCRMMDDRPRHWRAKIIESFRALQLERQLDKDAILATYLNIAPYGGNIRGVEAAAQAYFGKQCRDLSLAEAALIAGLPQSPSRLRPDRHLDRAKRRQALVLSRMAECGMITAEQAAEAGRQPLAIVSSLRARQDRAVAARAAATEHGAWFALARRPLGGRTTFDQPLEREIRRLAKETMHSLPAGTDAAVVVIDIATGDLLAMIGTVAADGGATPINAATARRSPGSTLKPFVYAAGFEARRLNEASILYDGPIERAGWSPSNFDRTFAGEVTVAQALRRSLNVPAILAAEGIGLGRCIGVVEAAGIALPRDAAARGGLAVVTGAIEVSLLDLTNAYATLGRGGLRTAVRVHADDPVVTGATTRVLAEATCAMLDDILGSGDRRPRGMELLAADDVPWFMWKTGTSSGRRDAWAVGHNRKVAIGVWIGRHAGSGDVRFVGGDAAESLLARLFDLPTLRAEDSPSPAASWSVTHPLPVPREQSTTLRIVSPATGSRFLAVGGQARIHPRSNGAGRVDQVEHALTSAGDAATGRAASAGGTRAEVAGPVQWFLDGRRLMPDECERLEVGPGRYELRCVDAQGRWALSVFEVR